MWFVQSELCAASDKPTEPSTRAISSITVAYSTYPIPAPPYSSGKSTPINPSSPIFVKSSRGRRWPSSHSITCGLISASANSRTERLTCCCSSVKSNPIGIRIFLPRLINNDYELIKTEYNGKRWKREYGSGKLGVGSGEWGVGSLLLLIPHSPVIRVG